MGEPILVTAALPYANGSIHIGHLLEYTMTDIYVRALRLAGEDAVYICADDTHGTPIELSAQKAGMAPEVFVAKYAEEHVADFKSFEIRFDSFYSTNSLENRVWVYEIFEKLKAGGYISRKPLQQLYDEQAGRFLPDRFVKGTCPKCGAKDQYGDVCEVCSSTYEPTDLIDPYSTISGSKPVLRTSEHLFVDLAAFTPMLKEWVAAPGHLQPPTRKFVEAWIEQGLRDWCISRDAPYFGFPIPGEPEKYFYVWLDAPIGYISSTENWARSIGKPELAHDIWRRGKGRIEHVIGKDIVYFHTLFWPACLHAAGLTLPSRVQVHGMLTIDGVKMSKTRGTFINASTFRKHVDPVYLRYYFASKIGPNPEDVDLSIDEFVNRVNADLVNNLANLVVRGVQLTSKLGGRYGKIRPDAAQHVETAKQKVSDAEAFYRAFDLAGATRLAIEIATLGNKLFQDGAPWKLVKENEEAARDLVTLCLNLARASAVILTPVAPNMVERIYSMLGLAGTPQSFREGTAFDLTDRPVGQPGHVLERFDRKRLEAVIEESKPREVKEAEAQAMSAAAAGGGPGEAKTAPPSEAITVAGSPRDLGTVLEPALPAGSPRQAKKGEAKKGGKKGAEEPEPPKEISIDKFLEIDLRVGLILKAELVEGSDRLLRLTVDLGEEKPRNILAGIRVAYDPKAIEGTKIAVVANLAPRKMKDFGTSEGMVLAGGPGGKDIWLCTLPAEAVPGSRIR